MGRMQKLLALIRQGNFRLIWQKGTDYLRHRLYTISAVRRDKRYGGVSVNALIPSKHTAEGAYATQSSDYRCLDQVFAAVPLRPDDVFVDVGCGEGRVLTYLCEQGFRGSITGIELDADAAKTAIRRTAGCPNVSVCVGNVLEHGELFRNATAVYLFNPFDRAVVHAFVQMLETVSEKPVRLYYLNSQYADELGARWTLLSEGVIRRPSILPMQYTVHALRREQNSPGGVQCTQNGLSGGC